MVFRRIEKRVFSSIDWPMIISVTMLCAIGLLVLMSAGYDPDTEMSRPMKRQAMAMGVGAFAFLVCMFFNTAFWKRGAYIFYALGCILLILIFFKGVVAGGARRWLDLGVVRMQPSEFMKIALVLALARAFSHENAPRDGYTFVTMLFPCVLVLIPVALIVNEPDLGTALCHILIAGGMLMLAGVRWKTMLRLVLVGALLAVPAWHTLKDYQRQRVLTFLSPEQDPQGSGYHALQSKIAVGSGQVTGKGFLQGTQTQLRFLPEQTTDFIFSVLAEEWGFLGSVTVIFLYGFLISRLLTIASRCNDRFPAFVSVGIAAMIFWHVVVNVGMVTGILPVVGLTLPLLSYGGSSAVAVLAGLGIVAGFSMKRFTFA